MYMRKGTLNFTKILIRNQWQGLTPTVQMKESSIKLNEWFCICTVRDWPQLANLIPCLTTTQKISNKNISYAVDKHDNDSILSFTSR